MDEGTSSLGSTGESLILVQPFFCELGDLVWGAHRPGSGILYTPRSEMGVELYLPRLYVR